MDAVRHEVEEAYPLPIAVLFRKFRLADPERAEERQALLGDLAEVLVKLLAACAFMERRNRGGEMPGAIQDVLKSMVHPSLGTWKELLRTSAEGLKEDRSLGGGLRAFCHSKAGPEARESVSVLAQKTGMKEPSGKLTMSDLLSFLITYRNMVRGHGARLSAQEYAEHVRCLEPLLRILLDGLSILREYELFSVDETRFIQEGQYEHRATLCRGTQVEPARFDRRVPLPPRALYLRRTGEDGEGGVLGLNPLAVFHACEECRNPQVFLFNGLRGSKIEYLSYSCGHRYFPETLSADIEALLRIQIPSAAAQGPAPPQTPEENRDLASSHMTMAMQSLTAGRLDEALGLLQASLMYQETAEAHHRAGLLCLGVGRLSEAVFHLRSAADLDPRSPSCAALAEAEKILEGADPQQAPPECVQRMKDLGRAQLDGISEFIPPRTPFHYATPRAFQGHPFVFWGVLLALAWGARIAVGKVVAPESPSFLLTPFILGSALALPFLHLLSRTFRKAYYPMMNLVSAKSRERFPDWFSENLETCFGRSPEPWRRGPSALVSWVKRNPSITAGAMVVYVLCAGCAALTAESAGIEIYSQGGVSADVLIMLTSFDGALFLLFACYPAWVAITAFVVLLRYANLSLKPLLGKVNKYSLDRIQAAFFLPSAVAILELACVLSLALVVVRQEAVLDMVLAGVGGVLATSLWSLGVPYSLHRSLANAKAKVSLEYARFLETAFQAFMEEPEPKNAERYEWLLKEQKKVSRISTNPLSLPSLLAVIAMTLAFWILCVGYGWVKYHRWHLDAIGALDRFFS